MMRSLQSCQVSQVLHLPAVTRLLQKKKKTQNGNGCKTQIEMGKGPLVDGKSARCLQSALHCLLALFAQHELFSLVFCYFIPF